MAKFTVTSPVKHKGKIHAPGKTVELDEDTAAELIEAGAVEPAAAAATKAAPEKAAPEKAGK